MTGVILENKKLDLLRERKEFLLSLVLITRVLIGNSRCVADPSCFGKDWEYQT